MINLTNSTYKDRKRGRKESEKQEKMISIIGTKQKAVQNTKKVDQEESKDEEALLVPSFPYVISFMTPSVQSFQNILTKAMNYAHEVDIGKITRDQGAPADEQGFLSNFLHKVLVQYNDYKATNIKVKIKSVMRKIEYAIGLKDSENTKHLLNLPNRNEKLLLLKKISKSPKSKNIRDFFIEPEISFMFVLLVPHLRQLPYRESTGNLKREEISRQNEVFSPVALKKIQQTCKSKFPSKSIITIAKLMIMMNEELSNQALVSDIKQNREKWDDNIDKWESIDDAISTLINMIEIIFLEKLQKVCFKTK